MYLKFTEEHLMLRQTVREFANSEIKPLARKIDEEEYIPRDLIEKIAEVGLLGTAFPEKYGGGGFGEVGYCIAQEEVARVCGSTATFIGAHQSIGTNAIFIGGSEELKEKYLPLLTSGNKIAAFCLTEAQAGSDSFNIKTSAVKKGNKWIINGEKLWITNGAIADIFTVFARTDKGITGFVVEKDFGGVEVGPNEKKMGIRGSVTNPIRFNNVEVPEENLIGKEGRGFPIAMKALDAGRLTVGACSLGAAKEMLELSVQYANQRIQFDQPISRFEAIQFMIADMTSKIYLMESILFRAAQKYDEGLDVSQDAAIVKLYASEAVQEIADMALQIHGGMGYSRELPIERFYRDVRILKIFEGTSEIQKLIISRKTIKNNGKWRFDG
ncbi:acyl-CoA dehydrogenase domain-containing protein [Melioribacter roseus P3M-2]|uniref:Acyl-CoA dehydrogenase domain-containing protein n=1 Tax=Melioribacter roseus (strain DSM 23840 / JCM 17771 / VKM B-2668 / P3M-2) TaxID=1191523 RepID=I6YZL0_MELRP|nr:acyl-CoA dehydrogenase family protein [Melioribacter roseus]AFN75997.1 acyl-CoA dehydrogenase domain-containing protein [Melioribacter roseus P3M-2]